MPENLEIKLRAADLGRLERVAKRIGSCIFAGEQLDTYFRVPSGRLKLRETPRGAELIFYRRPDELGARLCDYVTVQISQPGELKSLLTELFGIKQLVRKHRKIYVYRDVRIQLDKVNGLGCFIEFEIPSEGKRRQAHRLMKSLIEMFQLEDVRPIGGSYSDVLRKARK